MKTKLRFTGLLLIAMMLVGSTFAQRGMGKGQRGDRSNFGFYNDLTDAQKTQIDKLRTPHQKEMLTFRNQFHELRAQLQTLQTADKPDMGAINKKIDEMGALRTKMQKAKAAHRQEIRKILTEEQRVKFDSRVGRMGKRMGKGMGRGHGKGRMGRGQGMRGQGGCQNF